MAPRSRYRLRGAHLQKTDIVAGDPPARFARSVTTPAVTFCHSLTNM
ncbi:MAG: hypothetical protein OJF47_004066 [Nitrospira sp.]|nr:MAG: hypothetical protein OJF47_004066 [Nitrospira sp.]